MTQRPTFFDNLTRSSSHLILLVGTWSHCQPQVMPAGAHGPSSWEFWGHTYSVPASAQKSEKMNGVCHSFYFHPACLIIKLPSEGKSSPRWKQWNMCVGEWGVRGSAVEKVGTLQEIGKFLHLSSATCQGYQLFIAA